MGVRVGHAWVNRVATTAMLGCVALTLAACGAPSAADDPQPSRTTPPPETASTPVSPTAAISALADYRAMWSAVQQAAITADYRSALLPQHAAGTALSVLVRGLYSLRLQHLVTRGEPVLHPSVTALLPATDPTKATIRDCLDDTHWLNYKTSGGLQDNQPGGHRRVNATVTYAGGAWKVTALQTEAEATC